MDRFDGFQTKERCPDADCSGLLYANQAGAKWCTNIRCSYHTRHGAKVLTVEEIEKLHFAKQYRKLKPDETVLIDDLYNPDDDDIFNAKEVESSFNNLRANTIRKVVCHNHITFYRKIR